MSCHSTRLLFLHLINFTSCDFCFFFFYIFDLNLFILFHSCCFFFFLNSFLLRCVFFLFTLICIISSYLSDVITEGVCLIDCFRFCLLVCFSGQISTVYVWPEKQNLCNWFWVVVHPIVVLEGAEPANLLPRGNRFALTSLLKGLIFSVDIPYVEIYSLVRKDSLLFEIFAIVNKKK